MMHLVGPRWRRRRVDSLFAVADNPGLDSNVFGSVPYKAVRGLVVSGTKGPDHGENP